MAQTATHDGREAADPNLIKAVFTMLILGGHIGFPFMLLCIIILRNPYARSLLYLHFCFAFVLHSIAFSILLYSGNALGPEPSFGLCVFQSILVYIAPVLASAFLLSLVYHLCFTITSAMNPKLQTSNFRMMTLVAGPYFASLVPAFAASLVAMYRPETVVRGHEYYCSVDFAPLRAANAVYAGIFLASALVIQARIAILLYRNRLILKQVKVQGFGLQQLFVRLCVFIIVSAVAAAMALVTMVDPNNAARSVFQAMVPLLAFLTFGTRLSFYRRTQEELQSPIESPSRWQPQTAQVIA